MKCTVCNTEFKNTRGLSNHNRWKHKALPFQEKYRQRMKRYDVSNPNYRHSTKNYHTLHGYMHRRKIKPARCETCGKETRCLDMAFKDHSIRPKDMRYTRDPNDWIFICRSCHMNADGRINNLKQYRGK